MKFSRRDVIKGMGAAGLTPMLVSGCGGDSGASGTSLPPLPELPEYVFDGTPGPETMFEHGVASGDPLADGVILWTRVSPAPPEEGAAPEPVEVWWEMALDTEFTQRTAQGTQMTDSSVDHTVKVDVSDLVWGREYYYRFFAQGRQSPIGRTRLAPTGDQASRLRFGVCSCSNYGNGYFYGYRHMAARSDLDAVIHLGDYFYEGGNGTLRMLEPPHETVTLEDYRTRFSLYRREDPDLQELHRQFPFIAVWDDHETANNSWMGGAENHDPETEGPWEDRVAAARQAFFEWIPIRENPTRRLFRTIKYGDLADIIMLDTRIEGREKQFEQIFCDVVADADSLPNQILGADQEAWLLSELTNSTAKWRVLGNQVVMGFWQGMTDSTYFNDDQWNCYPAARDKLVSFLRDEAIANVVVITGDVHSSWAMDVTVGDGSYSADNRDAAVAVEFVTPGITSPTGIPEGVIDTFKAAPHVRDAENSSRGYLILDLQADKAQADWYLLDGVGEGQGQQELWAAWAVMDGQSSLVEMDGPETDNEDAPPLAPA